MKFAGWLFLFLSLPALAWGEKGHRLAATASLQTLPPELGAWYASGEAAFATAALEPDLWKLEDPSEVSRHRIYCEAYGGADKVPLLAAAAKDQLGAWAFESNGQLPWVIAERYRLLVVAFKSGDRRQVVQASGWLCHYIADAQVPLHTTRNRNGKQTGQKGVHHRWETDLVNQEVTVITGLRQAAAPVALPKVVGSWIQESYALVPAVLAADHTASRKAEGNSEAYHQAFWSLQKETIEGQLRRAAERTGDLLLAAWVEAGKPRP